MIARKTYVTVLNVFSCLAVLFLHTGSFWNFRKSPGWIAANLVECVFYFAVPVFIMLSGVTLMDYRERCTTQTYFKKRILKTVIPFLFWSIVGLFFVMWRDGADSVSLHPVDILNAVINCKYIPIYYFFMIIFGIYLAIPVLGSIPKEKRQRVFLYCIFAALTVNVLFPFLATLTGGAVKHNNNFAFSVCTGYLPYVLIGYYLDNYTPSRKRRMLIYALGLLGLAAHFFGTLYLSYRDDAINSLFKGYAALPCVLYASAVFLLFKMFPFDKLPPRFVKALTFFGGQTFGIYLIHIQLMTVMDRVLGFAPESFPGRLALALILFVVCGLLIKGIQKIPVIKHIVP